MTYYWNILWLTAWFLTGLLAGIVVAFVISLIFEIYRYYNNGWSLKSPTFKMHLLERMDEYINYAIFLPIFFLEKHLPQIEKCKKVHLTIIVAMAIDMIALPFVGWIIIEWFI